MSIDFRLLRAFVMVAETENVGRAAERLHISQSPLSRQIMQFEEQLGLALFERVRQRVRLTDEGRRFLEDARRLLAHAEQIESVAHRLAHGEIGRLAIGYVEGAMHSDLLPAALARLRESLPASHIELHPLRSAEQWEALRSRRIDFGLAYRLPDDDTLEHRKVLDEPLALAMTATHPLAERNLLSPKHLDGQPWIALSGARNPEARRRFLDRCRASGFRPDIRLETDDLLTALRLVANGLGLTFVQASLRDALPNRLQFREVPWFRSRVEIHAIWRKHDPKPLVARFEKAVAAAGTRSGRTTRRSRIACAEEK